jgi:hypothetical protein
LQEDVDPGIQVHHDNPQEQALLASFEAPVCVEQNLGGEDSDFQVPVQLKKRATCARVDLRAPSPKKISTLRKRVKKGDATARVPPIPPSNLECLEAQDTFDPMAVGKPCWILHPLHLQLAIGYGKTGPTWKNKGQRLVGCCVQGEQMVQVHRTFKESVLLMFCEFER